MGCVTIVGAARAETDRRSLPGTVLRKDVGKAARVMKRKASDYRVSDSMMGFIRTAQGPSQPCYMCEHLRLKQFSLADKLGTIPRISNSGLLRLSRQDLRGPAVTIPALACRSHAVSRKSAMEFLQPRKPRKRHRVLAAVEPVNLETLRDRLADGPTYIGLIKFGAPSIPRTASAIPSHLSGLAASDLFSPSRHLPVAASYRRLPSGCHSHSRKPTVLILPLWC